MHASANYLSIFAVFSFPRTFDTGFLPVNRLGRIIATSCYTGYSPVAPGTVGSFLGLLIWIPLRQVSGWPFLIGTLIVFFIGVWAAGRVEKVEGHDAGIINIDEVVGMWVTLLFFPGLSPAWALAGFVLFRFMDVIKPFPANRSQDLPGGWGIMMDDFLAGIYAHGLLRLLVFLLNR